MNKKIIVKISEGLGNQLFMYANAFAISKRFNLQLNLDPYSGYYKSDLRSYMLDNFNISSKIATSNFIFSNPYKKLKKKILVKLDFFKKKKTFLFEKKNNNKLTKYTPVNIENTNDFFFIDGNFESEKYFKEYKKDLIEEFSLKSNLNKNKYLDIINNQNVVSICIRQNRFSERKKNKFDKYSIIKSQRFVIDTVDYVYRSIEFMKTKIKDPIFLLWSNDFTGLDNFFPTSDFKYVNNPENKILNDFFLLTQCKNFIVGPSTFNWWGAWLSSKENKICVRPKNLNPSNNADFWPEDWIKI